MEENYNEQYNPNNGQYNQGVQEQPEKGKATASLVLGIVGIILSFFGVTSFISIILGIIGMILAKASKKAGNTSGTRTGGFVVSIISLVLGILVLVVYVIIIGIVVGSTTLSY